MAWSLNEARLATYLATRVPGLSGQLLATKFNTGQSNPTYLLEMNSGPLEINSGKFVIRMKPPGVLLKSAHAIEREFRVLRALWGSGVPVPEAILLCEDPEIIGTPFYLMRHVEGRIFWDPALPGLATTERAEIYDAMNAALARLHSLDPSTLGLGDYGRPGNYFARQLARWSDQYHASQTDSLPDIDHLMAWLAAHLPHDEGNAGIVHGDWRIDNLIFEHGSARLLAVLDWELSTLGHPLADLAYQCMQWRLPHQGDFRGLAGVDRAALGIPEEPAYLAAYAARRGLAGIDDWQFCLAFSFFRLAAILQGVKKRALDGNASNPEKGLKMGAAVPLLARMAGELISG